MSSVAARSLDTQRLRLLVQVLLIAAVAVAIRLYDIDRQSLWNDELFSRYYYDLFGLKYLWTTGFFHESSPPLYYMAVAGWMRLFGTSEAAIRSLSVLASVLTLPFVYLIGKELFDRRAGLVAMLVFALLPMQVSFAQEARTYALLSVPIGMMLLAIARFLGGGLRQRVLWLYGAGAILALYCHATVAFLIAACNLAVFIGVFTSHRGDRRTALIRWICANLVVGALGFPELAAMLVQARSAAGIGWIPPFGPGPIIYALTPVVSGIATPVKLPGFELALLVGIGLAWAILARRPSARAFIVLIGIPAIFLVTIAVMSLVHPIFITRVFCWFAIPLALLLAYAIIVEWPLRSVFVAVAAVTCLVGLTYEFTASRKEPWRKLLDEVGPQLARADHVVLAPFTDPTAFSYYAPYLTSLQMWNTGRAPDTVENSRMPARMGVQPVSREALIDEIRSGKDTWLIFRTPDLPYVRDLLSDVPAPGLRISGSCQNVICITALSWTSRPSVTANGTK